MENRILVLVKVQENKDAVKVVLVRAKSVIPNISGRRHPPLQTHPQEVTNPTIIPISIFFGLPSAKNSNIYPVNRR
ncbi:hypothetical protein L1887_13700 [Cichorium endivia]|nr:hypothetical protein L1887_13700 [Cichorium endivia]